MTAQRFRRIALSFSQAEEREHMGHPDFRVNGKIFATLSHDEEYGVVMLSPAEQRRLVREKPATFAPAKGTWGHRGCTQMRLDKIDEATLRDALRTAWKMRAPKRVQLPLDDELG